MNQLEKNELSRSLKTHFGYDTFRPGQEEVIKSILTPQDTLALMPTGGGKSLCFQLPALLLPGLTLVVSPLIALMKDQVDALRARGIHATFLNSALSPEEIEARVATIRKGELKLVYLAPERLASDYFLRELATWPIAFVAIDEAHCVSQWGHDFRPDYLIIKRVIAELKNRPVVAAFTATATPEVKQDIVGKLGLKSPGVFVRGFDRPNLLFFTRPGLRHQERFQETARLLKDIAGSAIVYVGKRETTEELASHLKRNGIAALPYHAGMKAEQRTAAQEDFMNDRVRVMVATIAFGMGVDKPDVRAVIHAHMPGSLENYYQEAGRAGRDGEKAYCILLHSFQDTRLHQFFIQKSCDDMRKNGLTEAQAKEQCAIKEERLKTMEDFALRRFCRRQKILEYFGDAASKTMDNCHACDVCLNHQWKEGPSQNEAWHGFAEGSERHPGTLLEKLKIRRLSLANRRKVKPYMILDDTVLKALSETKPVTEEDMTGINGISPTWYRQDGPYFLRVIRSHLGLKKDMLVAPGQSPKMTAELFRQGKSVAEIMKERILKESTVLQHLCEEYERGALVDVSRILPSDIAEEIKITLRALGKFEKLRELKDQCSDRVQYHHLRLVLSGIKKEQMLIQSHTSRSR